MIWIISVVSAFTLTFGINGSLKRSISIEMVKIECDNVHSVSISGSYMDLFCLCIGSSLWIETASTSRINYWSVLLWLPFSRRMGYCHYKSYLSITVGTSGWDKYQSILRNAIISIYTILLWFSKDLDGYELCYIIFRPILLNIFSSYCGNIDTRQRMFFLKWNTGTSMKTRKNSSNLSSCLCNWVSVSFKVAMMTLNLYLPQHHILKLYSY